MEEEKLEKEKSEEEKPTVFNIQPDNLTITSKWEFVTQKSTEDTKEEKQNGRS